MGHRIEFRNVFDVRISSSSREMLARLSTYPSEVFKQPYLGYMLILYSDIDQSAYYWVRDHATGMDSMSGSDVGFAIFSARIPLRVDEVTCQRVDISRRRLPRNSTGLEPWEIRDLVVHGHVELPELKTDQELFVVNEAVFSVARDLGLTQHLPCIVAFDGVPHPEMPWLCIPIRDDRASRLFSAIRVAVGLLQAHAGTPEYRDSIQTLARLPQQLQRATTQVNELGWRLADRRRKLAVHQSENSRYTTALDECREAIRRGQQKRYSRLIATMVKRFPALDFETSALTDVAWDKLTRFRKTIHMLGRYATRTWPLLPEASVRLSNICSNYVRGLVGDAEVTIPMQSPTEVDQLRQRLSNLWMTYVDQIMQKFPLPTEKMIAKERELHERLEATREEIAGFEGQLLNTKEEIRSIEFGVVEASRKVLDVPNRPSFCRMLQRECHKAEIQSISEARSTPDADRDPRPSFWTSWLGISQLVTWVCERSFLTVRSLMRPFEERTETNVWRRPPTAFASYASADRPEVLRRIQGMRAWQPGLDIFVDFHSLFPGEQWKERLGEEISKRDRFLLFWSRAARASPYVESEWRMALKCRGLSFITPVPLEPPDIVTPPTELADLHFNDLYTEMFRYSPPI